MKKNSKERMKVFLRCVTGTALGTYMGNGDFNTSKSGEAVLTCIGKAGTNSRGRDEIGLKRSSFLRTERFIFYPFRRAEENHDLGHSRAAILLCPLMYIPLEMSLR